LTTAEGGKDVALKVQVFGRDMDVNEPLERYVNEKTNKLERFINDIQDAKVDLKHVKTARDAQDRYVAQITILGKGYMLRAEERTDDIRSAFDAALEKMQRQISKYKGKHYRGKGDGTSLAEDALAVMETAAEEEAPGEIVRRKKFFLKPMDEHEAQEQMELLGHENFFVFYNMNANAVNVLYRRRDNSYGLIDTEIA
jgi:putative sigma-54 modulation protein